PSVIRYGKDCRQSMHVFVSSVGHCTLPTRPCALSAHFWSKHFMHNVIPLSLATLIAVGIIVIGSFYLVSPQRISGTFGLKPPASDADTRAWLRPKGIRE